MLEQSVRFAPSVSAVRLVEVLAAEDPLPTALVGDAEYVIPSGTCVRLSERYLTFRRAEERGWTVARTWARARQLAAAGWVLGDVAVAYPRGGGRRLPGAHLRVTLRYLAKPPIADPLPERVVRRRPVSEHGVYYSEAEEVRVTSWGDHELVCAPERDGSEATVWRTEAHPLDPATADADLAELTTRNRELKRAYAAVLRWWQRRRSLTAALDEILAQRPWPEAALHPKPGDPVTPLGEVLQSDVPLLSPFVGEIVLLARDGTTTTRLRWLELRDPDSGERRDVSTWVAARECVRRGWQLIGHAELLVPAAALGEPLVTVGDLGDRRPITRGYVYSGRIRFSPARRLELRSVGCRRLSDAWGNVTHSYSVAVASTVTAEDQMTRSSEVTLATDAELADLDRRTERLTKAIEAARGWWEARPPLAGSAPRSA